MVRTPMIMQEPLAQEGLTDLLQEWGNLIRSLLSGTRILVQEQPVLETLQKLCDILVSASPHIKLVWIQGGDENTNESETVCMSGVVKGHTPGLPEQNRVYSDRSPVSQPACVYYPVITRVQGTVAPGCGLEQSAAFPFHIAGSGKTGR